MLGTNNNIPLVIYQVNHLSQPPQEGVYRNTFKQRLFLALQKKMHIS